MKRSKLADTFTVRQSARLVGLPGDLLPELRTPRYRRGGHPAYAFQDLRALQALRPFLEQGMNAQDAAQHAVTAFRNANEAATPCPVIPIRRRTTNPFVEAEQLVAAACEIDTMPQRRIEAERLYRRAIELNPHLAIAYTNLGNILVQRGLVEEAQDLYQTALRIDPHQAEAEHNLGCLKRDAGELGEAFAHFTRATRLAPSFADAYFNLGEVAYRLSNVVAARRGFTKYLELSSDRLFAEEAKRFLIHLGGPAPRSS